MDKPDTNKEFAQSLDLSYPLLSDPSRKTAAAYGVLGLLPLAKRWTFYIDKQGTIVRIDKSVNPGTAGEDLVKNLEELHIPRK